MDPCAPTTLAPFPSIESTTTSTEAPTTTRAPESESSSEAELRWVVVGLLVIAGAFVALTVLYWRHTRFEPVDGDPAYIPDTGQVAALVGVMESAEVIADDQLTDALFAVDPDATSAGLPPDVAGGALPTVESVFGPDASRFRDGTAGHAGVLLAKGDEPEEAFEYVEVDESEVDSSDGFEYLEVEVEVDDDEVGSEDNQTR